MTRWSYPNIKTVQLLPNVLAKTEANKNDAYEAIFVDKEGYITEGSSSNIWILNITELDRFNISVKYLNYFCSYSFLRNNANSIFISFNAFFNSWMYFKI